METCNGTQTPSETGVATTAISTTKTTTSTTTTTSHGEDEDSNFDRLTQMLPECFVSVKLENNEDTCATETSTNTVSPTQECCQVLIEPTPTRDMQNSQQVSMNVTSVSRVTASTHCFHHRGPAGCSGMPELPPWLQHCYTSGDSAQQASHNFHQSATYLGHEGSVVQPDRPLKSSAGIGGLANGEMCDSNTFLNLVLNQHRSSSIFLFDPLRSLHPNDTLPQHEGNASSDTLKHDASPSVIPPVEGNPTRRDAATNTQTIPLIPLDADAKTNTGECLDDGDTPKECHLHHCTKCDELKEEGVGPDFAIAGTCNKLLNRSCPTESKVENGKVHTNFIDLQLGRGVADCKCTNDCGNMCIKDNRRLHYVDIDRPFTCEICFKNYPSSTALMNHMRYHRGQRPYQCEVCNKAFATNSHLVTHRRVHTGERPFQCRLCRRSFADRSAYVKHERTHGPNGTIIKRYKCEECGNAFVDSCGLKKHVRIHTGERPYCCSVCQKTFSTSSTFVAHKRIHSGERPYKCENCDKMFITKSHLLTHRRTHTGEKPFSCQVCNRAFADGSSFRRHERLHTGENRHTCDICGKGFPFDTSLAKHKQSHIPGTPTYVYNGIRQGDLLL